MCVYFIHALTEKNKKGIEKCLPMIKGTTSALIGIFVVFIIINDQIAWCLLASLVFTDSLKAFALLQRTLPLSPSLFRVYIMFGLTKNFRFQ